MLLGIPLHQTTGHYAWHPHLMLLYVLSPPPQNCVRVQEGARTVWKLIDMDAATPIGSGFACLKWSTVYDPVRFAFQRQLLAAAGLCLVHAMPTGGSFGSERDRQDEA